MRRHLLAPAVLWLAACSEGGLGAIQSEIERALPGVEQASPAALDAMAGPVRLFDVRTPEEYAVSRLPGAVRVDPDMDAASFMAAHGDALAGGTFVFYCSVGWRSSLLADRVGPALSARGVRAVNLEGGAFGWRNEGRMLVRGDAGPAAVTTGDVHAYDSRWGRLIDDETARVLP